VFCGTVTLRTARVVKSQWIDVGENGRDRLYTTEGDSRGNGVVVTWFTPEGDYRFRESWHGRRRGRIPIPYDPRIFHRRVIGIRSLWPK
jgi:hypothetical protein